MDGDRSEREREREGGGRIGEFSLLLLYHSVPSLDHRFIDRLKKRRKRQEND